MPTQKETEMEVGGGVQRKNTWQADKQKCGTNKSIFYKYLFKFVRHVQKKKGGKRQTHGEINAEDSPNWAKDLVSSKIRHDQDGLSYYLDMFLKYYATDEANREKKKVPFNPIYANIMDV